MTLDSIIIACLKTAFIPIHKGAVLNNILIYSGQKVTKPTLVLSTTVNKNAHGVYVMPNVDRVSRSDKEMSMCKLD